jgi:hypothetical protein
MSCKQAKSGLQKEHDEEIIKITGNSSPLNGGLPTKRK